MLADEISNWEKVSAVATAVAVIVALGLGLAPALRERLSRARFELKIGDTEPHAVRVAGPDLRLLDEVVLRVEVRNVGRSTARRCWAQVNRRWRRDHPVDRTRLPPGAAMPYRVDGWVLVEEDPVFLRWSSLPFARERGAGGGPPVVDVARGHAQFAELAVFNLSNYNLRVVADDPQTGRGRLEASDSSGDHRWEVIVGADGAEPVIAVIEFAVDGKHLVRGARLAEPPRDAANHQLLSLLQQVVTDGDEDDEDDKEIPSEPTT